MRDTTNTDEKTMTASGWKTLKGNPDKLVCVAKATFTDGEITLMKSTKVVEVPGGCVVYSTTEHSKLGVAEAVTFVPGVTAAEMRQAYG